MQPPAAPPAACSPTAAADSSRVAVRGSLRRELHRVVRRLRHHHNDAERLLGVGMGQQERRRVGALRSAYAPLLPGCGVLNPCLPKPLAPLCAAQSMSQTNATLQPKLSPSGAGVVFDGVNDIMVSAPYYPEQFGGSTTTFCLAFVAASVPSGSGAGIWTKTPSGQWSWTGVGLRRLVLTTAMNVQYDCQSGGTVISSVQVNAGTLTSLCVVAQNRAFYINGNAAGSGSTSPITDYGAGAHTHSRHLSANSHPGTSPAAHQRTGAGEGEAGRSGCCAGRRLRRVARAAGLIDTYAARCSAAAQSKHEQPTTKPCAVVGVGARHRRFYVVLGRRPAHDSVQRHDTGVGALSLRPRRRRRGCDDGSHAGSMASHPAGAAA